MQWAIAKAKAKEALEGHKKGSMDLSGVMGAFIGLGVALIGAAFVALIMAKVGDTMDVNSTEANITDTGLEVLEDMVDLVQPLGIVVIAGVIIYVLVNSFSTRR